MRFYDTAGNARYMRAALTDTSSAIGLQIADDKLAAAEIATRLEVLTPATAVYESLDRAREFAKLHAPIVVKPLDSGHGNGISVGVDETGLAEAVRRAQAFSKTVVLQQQVTGRDVRLLYIGGKFVAATERQAASVIGDGVHTVEELIQLENSSPDRGQHYQKKYSVIPMEPAAQFLGDKLQATPANGEVVQVVGTANSGTGGTAKDITDAVPESLIAAGKKLVDELRLGVCGVDFIEAESGAYFIELNAAPAFRIHQYPHEGTPRNVVSVFVDWLLANKEYGR
jgi:cyanophycin synthetase